MNRVVYVKAHTKPVGKTVDEKVPTGEKKKGMFGGEKDVLKKEQRWLQTGWSDCAIDGTRLASDIEEAVNKLNEEGYKVVSITPVLSGTYDWQYKTHGMGQHGGAGYGYGYGYSFTEGMTIIAEKIT